MRNNKADISPVVGQGWAKIPDRGKVFADTMEKQFTTNAGEDRKFYERARRIREP